LAELAPAGLHVCTAVGGVTIVLQVVVV